MVLPNNSLRTSNCSFVIVVLSRLRLLFGSEPDRDGWRFAEKSTSKLLWNCLLYFTSGSVRWSFAYGCRSATSSFLRPSTDVHRLWFVKIKIKIWYKSYAYFFRQWTKENGRFFFLIFVFIEYFAKGMKVQLFLFWYCCVFRQKD